MTSFRILAAALIATAVSIAATAASAGTMTAAKTLPFTAKYAGTAVVKVTDSIADISANGSGTGTLLGSSKLTGAGTGNTAQQPCVPFGGTGAMTAANGTKLTFKVSSGASGCGDEAGEVFSISGRIAVLKGTGKLAKARGSLKFTGIYDRGKGTFSVKFSGTLTV